MLLSAGYEPPQQLFVHGFLLLDDRKISKSLGNVIDPLDLVDVYGVDAVRFWAARAVSFGQDGSASIDGVRERYERELGNDLGNLLSRTTAMIARYRDGRVVARPEAGSPVAAALADLGPDVAARLDRYDLTGALERIWEVVRALNRYVETRRLRGSWPRTSRSAASSTGRCTTSPTGCAPSRWRSRPTFPETSGRDPRGARPARRTSRGRTSRTG